MRNVRAIVVLALAAMLVPAASLFAVEQEELVGRDIVELGTVGTVTGTLVAEADEWQLQVGDTLYDLHLGQFGHDGETTAALEAGAEATVDGFLYGEHIAPITLTTGDTTLRFRDEEGRPLWSGMRLGPYAEDRPAQTPRGQGQGQGSGTRGTGWGRNRT